MLVVSSRGVLASLHFEIGSTSRINFLHTSCPLGNARRQSSIELTKFIPGERVEALWDDEGRYLLAWSLSGHMAVVDYEQRKVYSFKLNDTLVAAISYQPLNILPGCCSFILLSSGNSIINLLQMQTGGPFYTEMTPLEVVYKDLRALPACFVKFHDALCVCLFTGDMFYICKIFVNRVLLTPQEATSKVFRWTTTFKILDVAAISHSEFVLYGLELDQQVLAKKVVNIDAFSVLDTSIGVPSDILHVEANSREDKVVAVVTCQNSIVYIGNEGFRIINRDELALISFRDSSCNLVFAACTMDESTIYSLQADGAILEADIVQGNSKLLKELLPSYVNEGKSWHELFGQLMKIPAESYLLFITELLPCFSPSLRKAHQAGLLYALLQRPNSTDLVDYAWFFHLYYRLNHFWEVTVCNTGDLEKTLKAIERLDQSELDTCELYSDYIPSVMDLAIEAIQNITRLFGTKDTNRKAIVGRAMHVVSIHHRVLSSLMLISYFCKKLASLVEKYQKLTMCTLISYFDSLLSELEVAMGTLNIDKIVDRLGTVATQSVGLEFVFNKEPTPLVNLSFLDGIDVEVVANADDDPHILWRNDKDPINFWTCSRSTLNQYNHDLCIQCSGRFSQYPTDYLATIPFWLYHYQYCCPCGYAK